MSQLPFEQKVIGVGLGRTGTTSLSEALNQLGIKTKHFSGHLTREELMSGSGHLAILNYYQGIANGTASPYRQIDQLYPGSKFILTVREKDAWLESKRRYAAWEVENWSKLSPQSKEFKRLIRERVYGSFEFDEDLWFKAYEKHVRGVLDYFKDRPADLLVMDISEGDGWEKLCSFLKLPVPSTVFPHTNAWGALSDSDWSTKVTTVWADIEKLVPSGHVFILVDDCQLGLGPRPALPFLEKDGQYWGASPDDETAIRELERMRQAGDGFIVFAWPAFWWLDYYTRFHDYLRSRFRCVLENDLLVGFDLRT
jgi:hypothetical protein